MNKLKQTGLIIESIMQYSLHLQFSHPKGGGTNNSGLTKALNSNAFCEAKNKICEKCNRIHLVHCPLIDVLCKQEKIQCDPNLMNKNHSLLTSSSIYDQQEKDIFDAATVNKEDEIKIEGNIRNTA